MRFTGAVLPGGYDVNLASWLSERLGGKSEGLGESNRKGRGS